MAYAGLFNEKVEIFDFVQTKSNIGVITNEMVKIYDTRAKVGHISGSRTVINSEIQVPYMKNFVLRVYVPVTETCWIKYDGKYYRVTSIDVDRAMQQQVVTTELVQE